MSSPSTRSATPSSAVSRADTNYVSTIPLTYLPHKPREIRQDRYQFDQDLLPLGKREIVAQNAEEGRQISQEVAERLRPAAPEWIYNPQGVLITVAANMYEVPSEKRFQAHLEEHLFSAGLYLGEKDGLWHDRGARSLSRTKKRRTSEGESEYTYETLNSSGADSHVGQWLDEQASAAASTEVPPPGYVTVAPSVAESTLVPPRGYVPDTLSTVPTHTEMARQPYRAPVPSVVGTVLDAFGGGGCPDGTEVASVVSTPARARTERTHTYFSHSPSVDRPSQTTLPIYTPEVLEEFVTKIVFYNEIGLLLRQDVFDSEYDALRRALGSAAQRFEDMAAAAMERINTMEQVIDVQRVQLQ